MLAYIYVSIVLFALVILLRRPLLRLLTPRGLPDIPAYPDPKPFWGDLHLLRGSTPFTFIFDKVGKDLGPIAQFRLGFFNR